MVLHMKKQFLLFAVLGTVCSLIAFTEDEFQDPIIPFYDMPIATPLRQSQPLTSYILRFRFPASIKENPPLRGYYKGFRLNFSTDYCLINEIIPSDSFTLVITDDVHRRFQNNATKDLKRAGEKCRMFYITKKQDGSIYSWDVEEENKENIPIVLPKGAIIIIFDPDLITGLKKNDDLMKIKTGCHTLYLPIIELTPK